ncbi:hypothetical protein MCP1_710001 [Candidatus Terasakiella magnetica]|nr:hypothetical protein MCP1_710001 [Candidatus Terasakiella magnetica]
MPVDVISENSGHSHGGHRGLISSLAVGLLLLTLIWAAIVVTTTVDRNERRLDTERTMANVAQAFEERTLRTLGAFDRAIHLLRLEYLRAPTQFPVRAIELQRDIFPDQLLQVSIVGPDGYMVFSNLAGNSSQVYVGDREHFKVHVHSSTDQLYISQAVLGRISGRWSLQLTRKITSPDGSFGGVIVLSIPPSAFGNFYDSLNLGEGGALTLVGLDGHIRSRISQSAEDTAAYSKQMPPTRPFMDMAKPAAGLYTEASPVDGVMRIIAYRRLPDYPLVVLAHVPETVALIPAEHRRAMLFQAGLVLTLLVLAAAYAIGRLLDERQRNMVLISTSEERFRSLVEGTTDWVWETDAEHRFTWFSGTFETIIGIPSSRLLGKLRREMVSNAHEIDAQRWAAHRNDLEGHRVFRDFRYWIQTGENRAKWISIR